MNYDAKSPTFLSAADVDCQAADEATTTPISSTSPTDVDEVSTANDWCAWCGRGQSTDAGDLDAEEAWPPAGDEDDRRRQQPAYDQLRFCSRSCLSRYKMDLFCRETQRYLQQFQVEIKPLAISQIFSAFNYCSRGKFTITPFGK